MPNTLGLDDDLDPISLLTTLEKVFDVEVSDDEAARTLTVGDLYDLLLTKIPRNGANTKCANSMVFYRLQNALHQLGYDQKFAANCDIRFLERGGAKSNLRRLQAESGLDMPKAIPTRTGRLMAFGGLIATFSGLFFPSPCVLVALLGLFSGLLIAYLILSYGDPGRLPPNCITFADLTRVVAALNYGRLVKMGARHREKDLWDNLVEVLSCYALPKSEITRETLFLQKQLEKRSSA